MALQADPTVQYAIFLATGRRKTRLFERTTRSRRPTTPTCTPACRRARSTRRAGGASRRRCIPAKVPYLYFVAGPDGRHVFARTYDEHLRNIAQVAAAAQAARDAVRLPAVTRRARPSRGVPRRRLADSGLTDGAFAALGRRGSPTPPPRQPPRPDAPRARPRAGRRRSRGTASRRPIAPAARSRRHRAPSRRRPWWSVTRHGPMPQ